MNARELNRLRAALTSRREELQSTVARIQQELRHATPTQADEADQAVASNEKNALQLMRDMASRQLRSMDDALHRIEVGTYGECVNCGNEIALTRLEAIPWARLCVACQQLHEEARRP